MSGRRGRGEAGAPRLPGPALRRGGEQPAGSRLRRAFSLALVALVTACAGDGTPSGEEASTISRDRFIEAYVALRVAALLSADREIAPAERDRILAERGLSEQDLLEFVDVHGPDVEYMRDLWNAVDSTMTELRNQPDTSAPSTS